MYALALIRYRRPLDEVTAFTDEHRAYLRSLKEQGVLVASGPLDPRFGGALLLSLPDGASDEDLDRVRDGDPYVANGVAQYELLWWNVVTGREDLDRALTAAPLAADDDASAAALPDEEGEFTVLQQFDSAIEAELARTALEAAGLYAAVWDEDTQLGPVTQGVRLVVRESDREQALKVLDAPAEAPSEPGA